MGTRGFDNTNAPSTTAIDHLKEARTMSDAIVAGHKVPADEIVGACRDLVAEMAQAKSTLDQEARIDSFRALLRGEIPPSHRGKILGSVLAQGRAGKGALKAMLTPLEDDPLAGCFSDSERTQLRDIIERPISKRVAWFTQRLEQSGSRANLHSGEDPAQDPLLDVGGPGYLDKNKELPTPTRIPDPTMNPRATGTEKWQLQGGKDSLDPAVPSPRGYGVLGDLSAREADRVADACRQGTAALAALALLATDASQRDVVIASLVSLGRTPECAEAVRDCVERMQYSPATGDLGAYLQDLLDGVPPAQANSEVLPDGWLKRSLDACSAPDILAASPGREYLVLPYLAERLISLRMALQRSRT